MNTRLMFIYTIFMIVLFHTTGLANMPTISNRKWILERIRDPHTKKDIYIDEEHYLDFRNGEVSFRVDCYVRSVRYEFIAKDSINFHGSQFSSRKGCIERDKIKISYYGKYKIRIENNYLIIQTKQGDHIYK